MLINKFKFILIVICLLLVQSCENPFTTSSQTDLTFDSDSENLENATNCKLIAPVVNITPDRFSTFSGDPITFSISIENKSSNCSSSRFSISIITSNAGFDASSVPSFTEVKEGSSSSISTSILTAPNLFPGNHLFGVKVIDQTNLEVVTQVNANVNITIVPECIRTATSVSYETANISGEVGQIFNTVLNIKNNDQNCLANNYQIGHIGVPSGVSILGVTNINLASSQMVSLPFSVVTQNTADVKSSVITTNVGSSKSFLALTLVEKTELFKISQVLVASVGDKSAQINWNSDQSVSGSVFYGETQSLGLQSQPSTNNTTHSHTLSNLKSNTTYFYQVRARDNQNKEVSSAIFSFKTNATPVMAVMPVITSKLEGANYLIELTQAGDIPAGGYQVLVSDILRADLLVINNKVQVMGLDSSIRQCFKIKALYSQLNPSQILDSLESCVEAAPQLLAPVISSANRIGDDYEIVFSQPQGSLAPDGGYDTLINNDDKNDNASYSGFTRLIKGLDKTKKQCFKLEARYTQLQLSQPVFSNEICVNGMIIPPPPEGQLRAFPTAYGGGAYATGGRGGDVYHVTNLNDSGAGSLRDAVSQPNRTVVFDVSGIIDLRSNLYIDKSNLTIAGQSAPEGGITITGAGNVAFEIKIAENIIMRFVRVRAQFYGRTAFRVYPSSTRKTRFSRNHIFDHMSISYAGLQGFSVRGEDTHNITFQNGLIAECKTGSLFGDTSPPGRGFSYSNTFRNTLFYNISHRTPNTASNGVDVYNNVVYNWLYRLSTVVNGARVNHFDNFYFLGRRNSLTSGSPPRWEVNGGTNNNPDFPFLIWSKRNIVENLFTDPTADNQYLWMEHAVSGQTERLNSSFFTETKFPIIGAPAPAMTAIQASTLIPPNAGAYKYLNADGSVGIYRDHQDTRYVSNTVNNTPEPYNNSGGTNNRHTAIDQQPYATFLASINGVPINSRPANFYGSNPHIPETWFQANVPSGKNHNDIAPSGYTWLEEYLNQVDR